MKQDTTANQSVDSDDAAFMQQTLPQGESTLPRSESSLNRSAPKGTSRGQAKRRLILDVTISATTQLNTGIQRVVHNVALASQKISQELGVECVPVVSNGGHLSAVRFDCRPRLDERLFRAMGNGWMGLHRALAGVLSRCKPGAGKSYLGFLSRLRKLLVPKTLVRGITNSYRRLTRQSIEFEEGDTFVLLDASWDLPLEEILQEAKAKQVTTATVIYDLIPVRYPQFHQPQLRRVFATWLNRVVRETDFLIGISETVKQELIEFVAAQDEIPSNAERFDSFRLGADFSKPKSPDAPSDSGADLRVSQTLSGLNHRKYYLAVGTIEPRKNHQFLLDAFDKVWSEDPTVPLVIAGKVGWMCDEVVDRIQSHRLLNQSLFFIDDATDQELAWLYQNGKALIFPSIVEGFGLPIVEAFHYRLPVFASDTNIHREVAGDAASYFDLADPGELVQSIKQSESGEYSPPVNEYRSRSWEASCRELLSKILDFVNRSTEAPNRIRDQSDPESDRQDNPVAEQSVDEQTDVDRRVA